MNATQPLDKKQQIDSFKSMLEELHALLMKLEPLGPTEIASIGALIDTLQECTWEYFGRTVKTSYDGSRIHADDDYKFFLALIRKEEQWFEADQQRSNDLVLGIA